MTWEYFWPTANLAEGDLEASGFSWDTLLAIREDYEASRELYSSACKQVAETIARCKSVHSTRHRTKDPDHLLTKIIRKRLEQKETVGVEALSGFNWESIGVRNYREALDDLAGVRALHLYKEEWQTIDQDIERFWGYTERFAYIRDGDEGTFGKLFEDAGCNVKIHKANYRSVHYVIQTSPTKEPLKVEIQVRTLFEEGWSEIDHQVRYPDLDHSPLLAKFLADFNLLAGLADSMGNFVRHLKEAISANTARAQAHEEENASLRKSLAMLERELKKAGSYTGEIERQLENAKERSKPREASDDLDPREALAAMAAGLFGNRLLKDECPKCGSMVPHGLACSCEPRFTRLPTA